MTENAKMPFPWYDPKFEFDEKTLSHHMIGMSHDQVRRDLMLAFQRDVEGKIRASLIEMGWTPPPRGCQSTKRSGEEG